MKKQYLRLEQRLMEWMNRCSKSHLILFLLGGLLILNLGVLLIPDIPHAHDLSFQLSRISSLAESFKLGEIPRVYLGYLNNYGYANGLFYGDLLLYIPALLVCLGMNVVLAYKLFLVLVTVATMATVYFCVQTLVNSRYASLVAVTLCTLSSYRVIDIFIRGALAEVCAFIFIPLIVVGLYEVIYRNPKRWYWLSIGFAGCFLTHNISFALMVGFTFLFVCFGVKQFWKEKSRFGYLILATVVTIGMVSYFLFPMLEQMMSDQFVLTTETVTADVAGSTRSLIEVFLALPYGKHDGIAGIGIVFVMVLLLRFNKRNGRFQINQLTDQLFLFALLSIWAVTPFFPWKLVFRVLSPLAMIQFSWRLFLTITVFLSILGGIYAMRTMTSMKQRVRFYGLIVGLLMVPYLLNVGGQYASYLYHTRVTGLIQPVDLSTYSIGLGEYLPLGANPTEISERGEVITSNDDQLQVTFSRKGLTLSVKYHGASSSAYLDLPLVYYKGYQIDDPSLNLVKSEEGLVRVQLNGQTEGTFTIAYAGTRLAQVTVWVSCLTTMGVLVYIYRNTKNSKQG